MRLLWQEELGFSMKVLDIGGGFGGSEAQLEQVLSTSASLKAQAEIYWFIRIA